MTALLGIGGSLLAGLLGRAAGFYAEGAGAGFIISVLGAILLLGYTGRSSGLSRTGSPFA